MGRKALDLTCQEFGNLNVLVEYRGETKTVSQWSNMYGLNANTVIGRINRGWDVHDALNTPIRNYRSN